MILFVAAASAATLHTCGDAPMTGCYTTLAEAVAGSVSGDTIVVASGAYADSVTIDHDLTVTVASDGTSAPFVRDLGDTKPIFSVRGPYVVAIEGLLVTCANGRFVEAEGGADVSIRDVSVLSGAVAPMGAILWADGANLDVQGSDLFGGAAGFGGQVYVHDGDLTLTGTTHRSAQATTRGGAISVRADAGSHTVKVTNALFDGLRAGQGGAIHVVGAALDVESSLFSGNSAISGGAIYAQDAAVSVSATRFQGNSASGDGGAVFIDDAIASPVVFDGVAFFDNTAENGGALSSRVHEPLKATNSAFYRNIADEGGGAIWGAEGAIGVGTSVFCGNVARDGAAVSTSGALGIANTRFVGHHGGSIVSVFPSDTVQVALSHIDAIGNSGPDGMIVAVGGDSSGTVRFTDSIVADDVRDGIGPFVIAGQAGLEARRNVFWNVGSGAWFETGDDGKGTLADPLLRGFDADVACAVDATELVVPGWVEGPGLVWPTWYGAGRDAASEGVDPDGSPADVGAVGGPLAEAAIGWVDRDGDGYPAVYDCNDDDPAQHPGLDDPPHDGHDVNCDRYSDDDVDHDDHDDVAYGGDDCDDTNPAIHPGAVDVPNNEVDENCDGDVDLDNDGWIWPLDCDDTNPAVHPGVIEDPNGLDLDCDGLTDVHAALSPAGCATPVGHPSGLAWTLALAALSARRRRR